MPEALEILPAMGPDVPAVYCRPDGGFSPLGDSPPAQTVGDLAGGVESDLAALPPVLAGMVRQVWDKDPYTCRHSLDVARYAKRLTCALGLGPVATGRARVAGLLHDIGKIAVDAGILRKPGRLTEEETLALRLHPAVGAALVSEFPGFADCLDAIRHHHERWDGTGYPFGLRGAEIPLPARVMAVADAFSAMTTDRPYRGGMARGEALAILAAGAGSQWCPACVPVFLGTFPRVGGTGHV